MIDNKNIPDADQLWPAAEKMLDRHFRKRRILIWFFSIIIPVSIIGLSLMMNHYKNSSERNINATTDQNVVVQSADKNTSSRVGNNSELRKLSPKEVFATTKGTKLTGVKKMDSPVAINDLNGSINKKVEKSNPSADFNVSLSKASKSKIKDNSIFKNNTALDNNSTSISSTTSNNITNSNNITSLNIKTNSNNNSNTINENIINPIMDENYLSGNTELVSLMGSIHSYIRIDNDHLSANENSWPKHTDHACDKHIGFEASVYGGAHYVQKSLSSSGDASNYLQHRKNEEAAVIAPSLGISLSANYKSFSLSISAEYATYGEKTNYYPYSNQQTINIHSNWNTYTVSYVDIDTAYITGNYLYLQTTRQRLDSSFVTNADTVTEYKYDKHIADNNGVNKFYYFEMPVELSYCISKGKAGIGVSGGVSPSWLVQQKGNYIRSDGTGLESFNEIKTFRKFMMNGRVSLDIYYRIGDRTKLLLRPQYKMNLNSIFENSYGIKQRYSSTGVLFGVTYMLN